MCKRPHYPTVTTTHPITPRLSKESTWESQTLNSLRMAPTNTTMNFDPYTDLTDAQAREKAREVAKDVTDSFPMLIRPSDVQNGAQSWDDIEKETLEREAHESATIMLSEGQRPYNALAHDLAIILRRNDLPRAPMSDLAFDDKAKAVQEGYWPNSMNRQRVTELLMETDIHADYHTEARQTVSAGIVDGLTDI